MKKGVLGLVGCGLLLLVGGSCWAREVPITILYDFSQNFATDTLVSVTAKQSVMPTDIPTPVFWFDCTQRDGWEYSVVDGTNYVTKIPSLVGGRFLTTDLSLAGTSWSGWGNGHVPKPPALLEFSDLPGGPALDFGPDHSDQGMIFSPSGGSSELTGIGSVVAVWGSAHGGGYILGGGQSDDTGYFWCRGFENVYGDDSVDLGYWCTVLNLNNYSGDIRNYLFMSDTFVTPVEYVGLNGTWEVAALQGSTTLRTSLGIGLGDTRQNYLRNGGCQFGEMLIFGEQLTEDQMRRLSVYLKEKWLGRKTNGWNGRSRLSKYTMIPNETTWAQTVDVDAGEELTIQQVHGGHLGGPNSIYNAAIVKTGQGTLNVEDASVFAAPIKIRQGTLKIGVKSDLTGTTADLPSGVFARFDASETSSLVLSYDSATGRRYVERMNNLGTGKYKGHDLALIPPTCAYRDLRPWLITPHYGLQKTMIYGSHRNADGRYFNFHYKADDGSYVRMPISGVATVLAVVSADLGGGLLGDGTFQRSYSWVGDASYNMDIFHVRNYGATTITEYLVGAAQIPVRNCTLWVDGLLASENGSYPGAKQSSGPNSHFGYPDYGTHVIAAQLPASSINTIGAASYAYGTQATDNGAHGGLIFGEIVIYNRNLTEDEMVRGQAYLMKKWLVRTAPTYANVESENIPQAQEVRSERTATLLVPDGETATVTRLKTDAPLVKRGGGALRIGPDSNTRYLQIKEGTVEVVRPTPTTAADCTVAKGASLHLDASDSSTLKLTTLNGTNFVDRWYSKALLNYAYQTDTATRPFLNDRDLLNGMPTIDFGDGAVTNNSATNPQGKNFVGMWMRINETLCSVRSVFLVCGSQMGGAQILGEVYNGTVRNSVDFWRNKYTLSSPIVSAGTHSVNNCTEFWLNGVVTNASLAYYTGSWDQLDMHTSIAMQAGALAASRGNTDSYSYQGVHRGRTRIAELIVYERELSERERVATRNYLTKKWFPTRKLVSLPAEADFDKTLQVGTIDTSDDIKMSSDGAIQTHEITGSGTLVKDGSGSLDVKILDDFHGTIDLRSGSLTVGPVTSIAPVLKSEGLLAHFDANYGLNVTTNADLSVTINSWRDRTGNRTAVPRYYDSTANRATLMSWGLNGHPAVDLPAYVSMWWQKDGADAAITNIGSVFWVFGSQNGGGFILGGGSQIDTENQQRGYYAWHRGWDPSYTQSVGMGYQYYQDAIWCGSGYSKVGAGTWRVNGEKVIPTTRGLLSGDWDIISWQASTENGVTQLCPAAGFAFDGRKWRYGYQRLAEVILYDHRLTDDEVAGVKAYLDVKWGYKQASPTNDVAVVLAEGTTLETDGDQYFRSISGDGTIKSNVTIRDFTATPGQTGLKVAGTLTIAEKPTFTLKNLQKVVEATTVTVATANDIQGAGNLADATFYGVTAKYRVKVRVTDNKLVVIINPIRGLMPYVR